MASITKRGRVYWGRAYVAGKDHKFSLRTGDRKTAQRRLAKKIEELRSIAEGDDGASLHTRQDAVVWFFTEYAAGNLKPATIARYQTSAKMVEPALLDKKLSELDGKKGKRVLSQYMAERRKAGASMRTTKRDLTFVSMVLAWAIHKDGSGIESNPAALIDMKMLRERPRRSGLHPIRTLRSWWRRHRRCSAA